MSKLFERALTKYKVKESKQETSPFTGAPVGKFSYPQILAWAKPFIVKQESTGLNQEPPKPEPKAEVPKGADIDQEVNALLLDSPDMTAATFLNLLKSKGFQIVDGKPEIRKDMEADSASANAQFLRGEKKKESNFAFTGRMSLRESAAADNGIGFTRFRAALIQEGMGNLRDGYYYTKDALKSAVPVFEGKKIYADHPSAIDEQSRPERSVRDVLGHFENVAYTESEDGRGILEADVVILPDKDFEWARALMRHAVQYSKKYPDKDFIGLSINANGDSDAMNMDEFARGYNIPDSALVKIGKAKESGLEQVRVVKNISEAISCDLVTEAGAGGRVTSMLEGDKTMKQKKEMKHHEEKHHEAKHEAKPEGEKAPAQLKSEGDMPEEEPEHADEDQDIALIKKMLAQQAKPAAEGEEEEAIHEAQEGEMEAMEAAREAYETAVECGHKEGEEAQKMAAHFMKMARHMAAKHEAKKEGEKPAEEKPEAKEEEAHKESEEVIQLRAEVTRLKEATRLSDLKTHIEGCFAKSGMKREATAAFKKMVGEVKDKKEFDEKFALFTEAYKQGIGGSVTTKLTEGFVFATEKTVESDESGTLDLSNCF